MRLDELGRPFGIVGLHAHEGDIHWRLLREGCNLMHMHGFRMRNLPLLLGHPGEFETVLADCLDMLVPEVNHRHVLVMQRKMSAHVAADCAAAEHNDTLTHYFLPAYVGDVSRSGKKTSDDLGTSAILGCANLVGLGKHQLLLGRRDNHDPGFVGENDITGSDLNLAQHDWLVDRGGLEVPFACNRRQAAHERWETGGPDCWPVARGAIDDGAGHAVLLAGIAVELAPARRIESAAIVDHHNIALLRDFAGDLLMAREPSLAVVAGTFGHLPQSDRRTDDFRARG